MIQVQDTFSIKAIELDNSSQTFGLRKQKSNFGKVNQLKNQSEQVKEDNVDKKDKKLLL